jgi:biopolymer transport protein TolR
VASSSSSDSSDEITGINVTPLVDVMLVLLIIFMVTTSYIVNRTIDVSLPKAESGGSNAAKDLSFVLDKDSKLYIDGKPAEFNQLAALIAEAQQQNKDKKLQALIAADRQTPHGAVIKLIDTVKKSGITEFAINVEEGTEP